MLRNYLKTAFRTLRHQRQYTLLNLVGLTIGMTGGLLIFLFVRHHLSTDRHHANFNRIYRIVYDQRLPDGSVEYSAESPWPMANALRTELSGSQPTAFLSMNRELTVSVNVAGQSARQFLLHDGSAFVEPRWFDIFDYHWLAGNPGTALNQPNTVVLTQSSASRYFGTVNPVGQRMRLNDKLDVMVTGLLADPAGVTDLNLSVFISAATLPALKPEYKIDDWSVTNSTDRVFVALDDNRSLPNLQTTLARITTRQFGSKSAFVFQAQPLADVHFDVKRRGGVIRASMLWSLGLIGLLLVLTACINFVNLATAQAIRRGKEVGVRKTLGSSQSQLATQFLIETGLMAMTSLLLALAVAALLLPVFSNWTKTPVQLKLDGQTILFTGLLLSSVILLAGGYPAVVLSGLRPILALRGRLTTQAIGGLSLRQILVGAQFVIGQLLLISAVVVTAQIRYIQHTDLGFQKERIVLVKLPDSPLSTKQAFKNELRNYPAIQGVSLSFLPPSTPGMYGGFFTFGNRAEEEKFPIRERFADPDYLNTFGMTLIAGHNLTPSDSINGYIVNEALLRKLHIRDPRQIIGQTMRYYMSGVSLPIVGVVSDFQLQSLHEAVQPCFIATRADLYRQAGIRLSGQDVRQALQQIEQSWQKFYPNQVFEATFLDDTLAQYYETETLISRLIDTASLVALLIGCLGLYGLVTLVVIQRTKEIGVRKVLGASVLSLVRLLVNDFLKLVLVAFVIAAPLGWYLMHAWLQEFAYKTQIEWWFFGLAGLSMAGMALLTVSFHSIKAALMNPVNSLRSE